MKSFWGKFFVTIIIILLFLGFGYYYKDNINYLFQSFLNRFQPCQQPIAYSIADIDPRFNITEAKLLNNIMQAEKIWESSIDKQLFEYSPTGNLKINLIYDYRQKAADALKELGIVINDDESTYNAVKAEYDSLVNLYDKEEAYITTLIKSYDLDRKVFEKDVDYWNSHTRATKKEYDALEQRRIDLNNQIAIINQKQESLNKSGDIINSTVIVLNKLIAELNLQVNTYNTIGTSTGEEFSEGSYTSDTSGTAINIFQFNNEDKLIKILAHELGHALGLEHLDNPNAIMNRLDAGINEKLTADDITALKEKCRIK